VQNTARRPKITVSADGKGLVSQAGAVLLAEAARIAVGRASRSSHRDGSGIQQYIDSVRPALERVEADIAANRLLWEQAYIDANFTGTHQLPIPTPGSW
jgi:hypothetical protein